jgi:PAS domain S-box-containing protein
MGITTSLSKGKATPKSKKREAVKWEDPQKILDIFHDLGEYAWAFDFSTGETHYSSEMNPFLGYKQSELTGERSTSIWWERTEPDDRHLLSESDQRYRNGLQNHHILEYRIRDRKGREHWVLDKGSVLEKDQFGKPRLIIGTHTDITELKETRRKLEEIEHLRKKEIVDAIIRNMEADRGYVAGELHNNINQILAAARMMLELIPMVNEEMGEYTQKVKFIIYNAVDEVNRICNLINPNSLDHVSLPELLKDQVKRAAKDKNIKIKLDINGFLGGKRCPRESELTMLRVVQDVVYRITNYSHATEASIILTQEKDFLHLDVTFNDPKFDLSRTIRNLRVVNLSNRCEHYGGTYLMEKNKGNGIHLQASVKIH